MKLKAVINGKEFDIAQGAVFAEEFNETLDSGSITIPHVKEFDIRPYDDVFIYDKDQDEFLGYRNPNYYSEGTRRITTSQGTKVEDVLVPDGNDSFHHEYYAYVSKPLGETCLNVSLSPLDTASVLVSWTNYYQTPAVTIRDFRTPVFEGGKLILRNEQSTTFKDFAFDMVDGFWTFSDRYIQINSMHFTFVFNRTKPIPSYKGFYKHLLVNEYSAQQTNVSQGLKKYKISLFSETKKLEKIQCPNISLTQPVPLSEKKSVWEYLNAYVALYSPKVKIRISSLEQWEYVRKYRIDPDLESVFSDIYAPDFTLTNPTLKDLLSQLMLTKDMIPYVQDDVIKGMDISKRNGAFDFSEGNVTSVVHSMSSSNYADVLRSQHTQSISQRYSARVSEYLNFRNSENGLLTLDNMRLETRFPIYKIDKICLCYYKRVELQDTIGSHPSVYRTFICKQDITSLVKLSSERNILSQDWTEFESGSPNLEKMGRYRMSTFQYDIGSNVITGFGEKYEHVTDFTGWFATANTAIENVAKRMDSIFPYGIYDYAYVLKGELPFVGAMPVSTGDLQGMVNPFSNQSLRYKGFFFQIEYEAFYEGVVTASKDGGRDDIATNDNPSSALTLLEKDGLFQKEKANRFGNRAYQINARYADLSGLQPLGSAYADDVVIFRREYAIYNNEVVCNYQGTKDYVLKNYYVSVFAKHRPFNRLEYDKAASRAENRKLYLMISKSKSFYETPICDFDFDSGPIEAFMSCIAETPETYAKADFLSDRKTNCALISCEGKNYFADCNVFVSGYSLCFNTRMFDNVSNGVYISSKEPSYFDFSTDNGKGSEQTWYLSADEYGRIGEISFSFGNFDSKEYYLDEPLGLSNADIIGIYDQKIFPQPLFAEGSLKNSATFSFQNMMKDNKETLDFTFQVEPISDGTVKFSTWLMRLSDFFGNYRKNFKDYVARTNYTFADDVRIYRADFDLRTAAITDIPYDSAPMLVFDFDPSFFAQIRAGAMMKMTRFEWRYSEGRPSGYGSGGWIDKYYFTPMSVESVNSQTMVVRGQEEYRVRIDATSVRWIRKAVRMAFRRASSENPCGINFDYANRTVFSNAIPANGRPQNVQYEEASYYLPTREYPFTAFCDSKVSVRGSASPSSLSYADVPMSATASASTFYPATMFIVSGSELDEEIVYAEKDSIRPVSADSLPFSIEYEANGAPYLKADISNMLNAQSVQYWYRDEESGSYVFVLGMNVSDEDRQRGYCKAYLSLLSTKDERVYDVNMNKIGEVRNYASSEERYGVADEIDID